MYQTCELTELVLGSTGHYIDMQGFEMK